MESKTQEDCDVQSGEGKISEGKGSLEDGEPHGSKEREGAGGDGASSGND
jgi:hypothetical protein